MLPDIYHCIINIDTFVKVQYLRYVQSLRISRTLKYAAFFEIAQALILNFLQRRLIATFYAIVNVCSYQLEMYTGGVQ